MNRCNVPQLRALCCIGISLSLLSGPADAKDVQRPTTRFIEPESIDKEWVELPKTYRPSNPRTVVEWLNKVISSAQPTDKFSTSIEVAQRDEYIRNKIAQKEALGILVETRVSEVGSGRLPCELSYSPNEAKLSYSLGARSYTEYKYVPRPTDNHRKILLDSRFKDGGDSTGQNAFGAEVSVSRTTYTDISIATHTELGASATSLSPEKARTTVSRIKCLVVFIPAPPFVLQQHDTKAATFDNPEQISTEDIVLFGRIENVWLVNPATREVLAKQH